MKDIKMPQAIMLSTLLVVVVTALTFLAYKGVESAPILAGVMALLAVLGVGIKQSAEQGERTAAIAAQVNGNNQVLVANNQELAKAFQAQQDEFRAFVERQSKEQAAALVAAQQVSAQLATDNQQYMREVADKMALMVPVSAVTISSTTGGQGGVGGPGGPGGQGGVGGDVMPGDLQPLD